MTKKQRIEELERKVDDLRREVDRLRDDVAVRPFVPCPYTPAERRLPTVEPWMPIYPEFPYQPPPYMPDSTDEPWPTLITGTTDNTADIPWQ